MSLPSSLILFIYFWGVGGVLLDTYIQKIKKLYLDTRSQRNIAKLNDELYEVQQIMTRNVQEVLGVGEKLDRKFPCFLLSLTMKLPVYMINVEARSCSLLGCWLSSFFPQHGLLQLINTWLNLWVVPN